MLAFKCPLCDNVLQSNKNSFHCANKHTFDIAREGYVNLQPVQEKKSREPGDSQDMLRARQQFLSAGYYLPLVEGVSQMFEHHLPLQNTLLDPLSQEKQLLDLGCGEGYYLQQLQQHLPELDLHGIDIAKYGVRLAAKRKTSAQLAVASAFKLPYFESSFDAILSIFSPLAAEECERVLKPQGLLLMVGPGERHLEGMVELIYEQKQAHAANFGVVEDSSNFVLVDRKWIERQSLIQGEQLPNLLRMTPYYWHCSPQQQATLANMKNLDVLLQFELRLYQVRSSN